VVKYPLSSGRFHGYHNLGLWINQTIKDIRVRDTFVQPVGIIPTSGLSKKSFEAKEALSEK